MFKLVGFTGGEEQGFTPIPIYVQTEPTPKIPGLNGFLLAKWQRLTLPLEVDGDCLEGIGIRNGQHVWVEFGEFDYQPGDIVVVEYQGHFMLKELAYWKVEGLLAIMRSRYADPTRDFEFPASPCDMYGRVIRRK